MPTRAERTALIFLSTVALVGGLVRVGRAVQRHERPGAAAAAALERQRAAVDSAVAARQARQASAGRTAAAGTAAGRGGVRGGGGGAAAAPSFPIDLNRAVAAELEALPRIGPALAARIVAARDSGGPFRSLSELQARVRGIGPALAAGLQPYVALPGG